MSRFSGKCDLFDTLSIREIIRDGKFTPDAAEMLSRWDIYVDDEKIEIGTPKDVVPYFGFIIGSGGFSDERCTAHLCSRSYNDMRADEHFSLMRDELLAAARKAKRRKKDVRTAVIDCADCWSINPPDTLARELAERVIADGKDAAIEDLLPRYSTYHRSQLAEVMVEYGYTPEQAKEWSYYGRRTW